MAFANSDPNITEHLDMTNTQCDYEEHPVAFEDARISVAWSNLQRIQKLACTRGLSSAWQTMLTLPVHEHVSQDVPMVSLGEDLRDFRIHGIIRLHEAGEAGEAGETGATQLQGLDVLVGSGMFITFSNLWQGELGAQLICEAFCTSTEDLLDLVDTTCREGFGRVPDDFAIINSTANHANTVAIYSKAPGVRGSSACTKAESAANIRGHVPSRTVEFALPTSKPLADSKQGNTSTRRTRSWLYDLFLMSSPTTAN